MANISLSSSVVAVSSIKQQAKFSFPVKFPLLFNIANLTNSITVSSSVPETISISGTLIHVSPISSNVASSTAIAGVIANNSNIISACTSTCTINSMTGSITYGLTDYEATTNLFSSTNNLSVVPWYIGGITRTVVSDITPNGQFTSTQLIYPNSNTYVLQDVTVSSSTQYTFSIWLKASVAGQTIRFSFEKDVVSGGYNLITLTTSWVRYSMTVTSTAIASTIRFLLYNFTGDNSGNGCIIYACNAQAEQKPYVTPFVDGVRNEGRVLETSILTGTTILNSKFVGTCTETASIPSTSIIDNMSVIVPVTSASTTNGTIQLNSAIVSSLSSASTISATTKLTSNFVPQTINATGTVTGIPTAIFTLVTNIIANTSIADTASNQESLIGNVVSSTALSGNLINLISGSVQQISSINIPQTFSFPITFPFVINDKVQSSVAISGSVTGTSLINNNSVQELLTVNLQATTTITGNVNCNFNGQCNVSSLSNISSSVTSKLDLNSSVSASTAATGNINEQVSIYSGVNSTSTIAGNITTTFTSSTNVISNTVISASATNELNTIGNLTSNSLVSGNIVELIGLISPVTVTSAASAAINLNSVLLGTVNATETINNATDSLQVNCQGDLTCVSLISGNLINLICSSLDVESNIKLPQTFDFPMTFPLVFNNNIIKTISIGASINAVSQIIDNSISELVTVNLQSNSLITGSISNQISLQGQLVEITTIELTNEINTIRLSGQLEASANISATTSLNLALLETVNVNTSCSSISTLELDCAVDLTSLSTINGKLYNLISSSVAAQGNISLPQTFKFPMTFPLVFLNNIAKEISVNASPITATSTITAYVCNAISSVINSTSLISGTIKNSTQLKSSLIATTNIIDSSFTGLIPMECSVESESIIDSTLLSNIKLNGSITCTNSILNTNITVKNVEIFETSILENTIIPTITSNTLYPVNIFATVNSETNILQTESVATNLQAKCIFYCNQTSNVQICNESSTIRMLINPTETVTFNANIATEQLMDSSKIYNTQLINSINFTSFKEE